MSEKDDEIFGLEVQAAIEEELAPSPEVIDRMLKKVAGRRAYLQIRSLLPKPQLYREPIEQGHEVVNPSYSGQKLKFFVQGSCWPYDVTLAWEGLDVDKKGKSSNVYTLEISPFEDDKDMEKPRDNRLFVIKENGEISLFEGPKDHIKDEVQQERWNELVPNPEAILTQFMGELASENRNPDDIYYEIRRRFEEELSAMDNYDRLYAENARNESQTKEEVKEIDLFMGEGFAHSIN